MKKTFPLRLTEEEHETIKVLRENFYNVSAFLRHCLKAEAEIVKARKEKKL